VGICVAWAAVASSIKICPGEVERCSGIPLNRLSAINFFVESQTVRVHEVVFCFFLTFVVAAPYHSSSHVLCFF
jgi:hypothetical protein